MFWITGIFYSSHYYMQGKYSNFVAPMDRGGQTKDP